MNIDARQVSSLLENLPAVYQQDRVGRDPNFLGRFLLAFEKLLLGLGDPGELGLEETIASLHRWFEPGATLDDSQRAPANFLPWLAGWVALTLNDDWDELRRRDLIAKAASLYRMRGTRRGVEEFLRTYTRLGVEIEEFATAMQIGVHSTVGRDTLLDGGAPHFFAVRVLLPNPDPQQIKTQREVTQTIIDLQKPAHTYYSLSVETPILQIGFHSTVGTDTLLG